MAYVDADAIAKLPAPIDHSKATDPKGQSLQINSDRQRTAAQIIQALQAAGFECEVRECCHNAFDVAQQLVRDIRLSKPACEWAIQ